MADGVPSRPRFAVGVGLASGADPAEVEALVDQALRAAGATRACVALVATVDGRADHPALAALGWPVVAFTREQLAHRYPDRSAPGSSGPARLAVAEPAALLAAGPGAVLVVPKRRSARATVAVARAG
jgi:cobalamin biosynthesis protein CbiG